MSFYYPSGPVLVTGGMTIGGEKRLPGATLSSQNGSIPSQKAYSVPNGPPVYIGQPVYRPQMPHTVVMSYPVMQASNQSVVPQSVPPPPLQLPVQQQPPSGIMYYTPTMNMAPTGIPVVGANCGIPMIAGNGMSVVGGNNVSMVGPPNGASIIGTNGMPVVGGSGVNSIHVAPAAGNGSRSNSVVNGMFSRPPPAIPPPVPVLYPTTHFVKPLGGNMIPVSSNPFNAQQASTASHYGYVNAMVRTTGPVAISNNAVRTPPSAAALSGYNPQYQQQPQRYGGPSIMLAYPRPLV